MPFGINVTGNLTITFALAMMTFNYKLTANKIIGHIFWMPGVPKDAYRISAN
jgi:F-type H+-transporting ATPase subunit a